MLGTELYLFRQPQPKSYGAVRHLGAGRATSLRIEDVSGIGHHDGLQLAAQDIGVCRSAKTELNRDIAWIPT
jgi:hypothetical protein